MRTKFVITFLTIFIFSIFAELPPFVDSLRFHEETNCDNANIVGICYWLHGGTTTAHVRASTNSGASWNVPLINIFNETGDLGAGVLPGTHCFDWALHIDLPNYEGNASFALDYQTFATLRFTTRADFLGGDTSNVKILTPDPDGIDDGALWIPPGRDTLFVLQVYPDGRCTNCMSNAIYSYMSAGTPALNIKIYMMTITQFNASAVAPSSVLSVRYINASGVMSPAEDRVFESFDVVMFGVSDSYAGRDLTATSANAVRAFCQLGKGLLLTHDTAGCSPGYCLANFCALTDITGISCINVSSWTIFTRVRKTATFDYPVLHAPFELPDTFNVLNCHWKGQVVGDGWILYCGIGTGSHPSDNLLYWQAYHNPTYNSFSSFYSYGHTEAIPLEWEAKAMINSLYYSYRGGIGTGVYTSPAISFPGDGGIVVRVGATIPDGAILNIEVALDTCIGPAECWTSWFASDAIPSFSFDKFRYRIGMTFNRSGVSAILHWIAFDIMLNDFARADGIIDSRPPRVSIVCPDTIVPGDTSRFNWVVEDLFRSSAPCTLIISGEGFAERLVATGTSRAWNVPEMSCTTLTIILAVRDSFCNWGFDTCVVPVRMRPQEIWFANTIGAPGETVLVPLMMDDIVHNSIGRLTFSFRVDPAMLVPIGISTAGTMTERWSISSIAINEFRGTISGEVSGLPIYGTSSGIFLYMKVRVKNDARGGSYSEIVVDSAMLNAGNPQLTWRNGFFAVELTPKYFTCDIRLNRYGGSPMDDYVVTFGAMPFGDEGYNPGLDVVFVPPPAYITYGWFGLSDPDYPYITRLMRDIRAVSPPILWALSTSGASDAVARWDARVLPEGEFRINGIVDMKRDSLVRFSGGDTLYIEWFIPTLDFGNISLHTGWNMVSCPLMLEGISATEVFSSPLGVFRYLTDLSTYGYADHVRAGEGYWVWSDISAELPFAGAVFDRYSYRIHRGWNLIGATAEPVPVSEISLSPPGAIGTIYGFDGSSYFPTDILLPGKGYWLLSDRDGILHVPRLSGR